VNSYKITDSNEGKFKIILIIFFPVLFISLFATGILWYKSYIDGNGGNILIIMVLLMIMISVLFIPPMFAFFGKRRMPTWLMVFILVVLFGLWEIGFDVYALLIFPIIVDVFILVYANQGPAVLNKYLNRM
jgi:Na+/melibiose symporter-like transporter